MDIPALGMVAAGGGGDEGLRCSKLSAGGSWKCNLMAIRGELFCKKHILWAYGNSEAEQTGSGEIEGANSGIEVRRFHDFGMKSSDLDIGKAIIVHGSVKKRRRPKGSKNKVKKGDVMIVNDAGIKRGRPKGSKNKIKTKDFIAENDDGINKEDLLVGNDSRNSVRKPGRPRGSKNKVKKKLCDDHDAGTSCTKCSGVKDLTVEVKKGVQDEGDVEIVVRKIGRPKGSKNKVKNVCDDHDAGIACTKCSGAGDSNVEAKKDVHGGNDGEIVIRKMGRSKGSKKVCDDHDVGIACSKCGGVGDSIVVVKKIVHNENDFGAIVRKRGRPKGAKR